MQDKAAKENEERA